MADWFKSYGTHILIGIALVALPILYAVYIDVSWQPLNPHEHLIQNGLTYIFLLLFSYVNHTLFVPRWFLNKRYGRYGVVAVSCIFMVAYLPHRIEQWVYFKPPREQTLLAWTGQIFWKEIMLERPGMPPPYGQPGGVPAEPMPTDKPPGRPTPDGALQDRRRGKLPWGRPPFQAPLSAKLAIFFLLGSVSTLLSISVQTANQLLRTSNRLRQVENDQLQAELRQLKAQIHPHFLFNTLNSIYALAIRKDERTADTIVKLSEFMRYMMRDAHREQVSLATEVSYIANYIDLQKARLRDAVQVEYQVTGDMTGFSIGPLLLFTFIENAFKYGVNPEQESTIRIQLTVEKGQLRLVVHNRKVIVSQLEPSTGIGLQNARDRLMLLYPNAHSLLIDNTPTHFTINLTLIFPA